MTAATWVSDLAPASYGDFFERLKQKNWTALLDLSAGYDLIPMVTGKGFTVSSIDAHRDILDPARQKRPVRIDQPDNSFTGIICVGTFSFLPREVAPELASEIERILSPGGIAFVSFAPLWSRDPEGSNSVHTYFGNDGRAYRRDHDQFGLYVVYQTREVENLFRRMKIASLVTQTNGARRLIVMKKR